MSNPAAELHGSPQGCTVRPRKGARQSSMGGGGGGGAFRVSPLSGSLFLDLNKWARF
jgi:hypothetical protein